jgi:hypothetical protein
MAGGALPRVTRRGRAVAWAVARPQPLWRACDRVEAALVAGLLAAFLIAAPLLALFAEQWAYGTSVRAQHAELAARHLVPATLLVGASAQTVTCCAEVQPLVRARWTAPDGTDRSGWVPALAGARAGSTVRVWVGRTGGLTGPPLTDSQVVKRAILAAMTAPTAMAIALLGAGVLVHWVLGRRRLAAWDAEWRATGPRWTSSRLAPGTWWAAASRPRRGRVGRLGNGGRHIVRLWSAAGPGRGPGRDYLHRHRICRGHSLLVGPDRGRSVACSAVSRAAETTTKCGTAGMSASSRGAFRRGCDLADALLAASF